MFNAANGTLSFTSGMQQTLLERTVRTSFKTARTYSEFGKLRATQQVWRTNTAIGKEGAQYLKTMKGVGKVCFGVTAVSSALYAYDAYDNNRSDQTQRYIKAGLDVTMGAIGLWGGPIGWGVSGMYFLVDVCGGWDYLLEIKED